MTETSGNGGGAAALPPRDYIWPDPDGEGWVDAWNGWYPTEAQAREDGAAGVGTPWVLDYGEGLISSEESDLRRSLHEAKDAFAAGETIKVKEYIRTASTKDEAVLLGDGDTVVEPEPELPMRWYEARVEVLIHEDRPSDDFGVGGDPIAHARAIAEGTSFASVVGRLDVDLGERWRTIQKMAPIADQDWEPPAPTAHEEGSPVEVSRGGPDWVDVILTVLTALVLIACIAVALAVAGS